MEIPSSELFESIISKQKDEGHNNGIERSYKSIIISLEEYEMVASSPGKFCLLIVDDEGELFSEWYFYHSLDGRLVMFIKTIFPWLDYNKSNISWSWQDKAPSKPLEEEVCIMPSFLERSCTRFDCVCYKHGRKCCEIYGVGPDFD